MPEKLKISVISFDNWDYDKEIMIALKKKNIIAHHINFGKYKHKSFYARLQNTLSKIFFNKNLKIKKRQDYILKTLEKIGKQDQILVLNPDLIEKECHFEIKKHTDRYIAYLYDSIARSRFPIEPLLNGVFDDIFSFDKEDSEKYKFKKTNNYIYLNEQASAATNSSKFMVYTIASFDNRFSSINKIANQLMLLNYNFKFILIGKNIFLKKINFRFSQLISGKKAEKINSKIEFRSKKIPLKTLKTHYEKTTIILDLVQKKQSGLSFRVFEAMALKKKLITDNPEIRNYPLYNPNNILLLENENSDLNSSFFQTPYEEIPRNIYDRYTIDTWVNTIFSL